MDARYITRAVDHYEGMLERVPYQTNPVRHEYRPTSKGREFFDVIAAMWTWGDRRLGRTILWS